MKEYAEYIWKCIAVDKQHLDVEIILVRDNVTLHTNLIFLHLFSTDVFKQVVSSK